MTVGFDLAADVVELEACPAPETVGPLREANWRSDSWLPSEIDELRTRFQADETIAEIALALGRGSGAVSHRIAVLGLRRHSARAWSDLEDAFLAREYGSRSAATIAGELGRSCGAVYVRAALLGLVEEGYLPWSAWEDAQLRAGYASGVPVNQLAVLIGRPMGGAVGRAQTLGIVHANQPPGWSPQETSRLLELADAGHRYLAIIETLVAEGFPRRTKAGLQPQLRKLGYGRGWGRRWSLEEDDWLRRAYEIGASLTPLKTRLGRTTCSIRWRVKELGLQGRHTLTSGWRTQPAWTADQEKMLRAEFGKTPSATLAIKLGRSKAAMFTRANALGLTHGYIRMFSVDERRAIGIAWRRGWPLSVVAGALNRDAAVVSKQAIRLGIPFDSPDRPVLPDRGRGTKSKPKAMSLAEILACEPIDALFDAMLESRAAANAERARRNRSTGASNKAGTVLRAGL